MKLTPKQKAAIDRHVRRYVADELMDMGWGEPFKDLDPWEVVDLPDDATDDEYDERDALCWKEADRAIKRLKVELRRGARP